MGKKKVVDGVIDAVRYDSNGNILLVRAFERRGPAFSDSVLLNRLDLIMKLTNKKKYAIGERLPGKGITLTIKKSISLAGTSGHEIVVSEGTESSHDDLDPAPIF